MHLLSLLFGVGVFCYYFLCEENMLIFFVKNYFIYFCTIYICFRLLNIKSNTNIYRLILFLCPFILTFFSYLVLSSAIEFSYIVPLATIWILIAFQSMNPQASFVYTILSFGISNSLSIISAFIISTTTVPFSFGQYNYSSIFFVICTAIVQLLLMRALFKIKRLKNGIPLLYSTSFINIATIICLILLVLLIFKPSSIVIPDFSNKTITIFLFMIATPVIIHWWQAQITKSYQHSLRLKELESLRIELQEKDKQLKEISENNKQMGHIIHEDTKLLRTLLSGIEDYVSTDFEDKNSLKMKGDALLEVINNHSDDRLKSIRSINNQKYKSYSTNIEALNLQLNHFAKRAAAENVTLYVHIACNLESYIPHILCDTDLSHLLSNLLDNAFIATSYTANRIIQLQFYEVNKFFVIEIADSGIPFETESLVNFGLTQRTTHEDEGGSGMGLMEIWKIKEKLGATLHIEEYEIPSPYSKKISFTFNRKNRFSIRSWRKDDIQQISRRIDLQTYDTSTF